MDDRLNGNRPDSAKCCRSVYGRQRAISQRTSLGSLVRGLEDADVTAAGGLVRGGLLDGEMILVSFKDERKLEICKLLRGFVTQA